MSNGVPLQLPPEVESFDQLLEMASQYWRWYNYLCDIGGDMFLPLDGELDANLDDALAAYSKLNQWLELADSTAPTVFAAIADRRPLQDEEWLTLLAIAFLDCWNQADTEL